MVAPPFASPPWHCPRRFQTAPSALRGRVGQPALAAVGPLCCKRGRSGGGGGECGRPIFQPTNTPHYFTLSSIVIEQAQQHLHIYTYTTPHQTALPPPTRPAASTTTIIIMARQRRRGRGQERPTLLLLLLLASSSAALAFLVPSSSPLTPRCARLGGREGSTHIYMGIDPHVYADAPTPLPPPPQMAPPPPPPPP